MKEELELRLGPQHLEKTYKNKSQQFLELGPSGPGFIFWGLFDLENYLI